MTESYQAGYLDLLKTQHRYISWEDLVCKLPWPVDSHNLGHTCKLHQAVLPEGFGTPETLSNDSSEQCACFAPMLWMDKGILVAPQHLALWRHTKKITLDTCTYSDLKLLVSAAYACDLLNGVAQAALDFGHPHTIGPIGLYALRIWHVQQQVHRQPLHRLHLAEYQTMQSVNTQGRYLNQPMLHKA